MLIKKKVKISIVTVVLNDQNKIVKTIQSVINQNYKDYEYIIVDGKSSDFTRQRIYQFRKYIDKIFVKKDSGIYEAMNLAIKHSQGEWIFFLNSGDRFYNRNALNFFSNKIFSSKIIYGNVIKSYKNFNIVWNGKNFNKETYIMPFSHQSAFVRTALLQKNFFKINFKIISDFVFFYDCFVKKIRFQKINKNISIVSTEGISNKSRIKSLLESIRYFFYIKKYFIIINLFLSIFYQILIYFFKIIIHIKIINKVIKLKKNLFDKKLRYFP